METKLWKNEMEYHERIRAYDSKMRTKNKGKGKDGVFALAELSSMDYPRPQHGSVSLTLISDYI